MTRPLTTRISTLERIQRVTRLASAICSVCGWREGAKTKLYVVTYENEPDDTPDYCPGCGRRQVYKLEFDRPGDDEHPTPIR